MREKELARLYLDKSVTPLLKPLLVKAVADPLGEVDQIITTELFLDL